ncbi:hypothetical protein E5358_02860 [Palleniella muris]|uniref:Uncharacterized protein n=1 Tax=Palleniella muris TaxID=3038145 RepID=A0AC61QT25_9BACT|nr:hypothetical protein [Palleniella muris]TGX83604.1 hypothetical protein E5358_02860 [Palleniella muris]
MGRNKYSQHEIDIIGMLLKKKCSGTRFQQKLIRHQLRTNFEFNISDFNEPGKAFGYDELQAAIQRGAIRILDDATIADMKAKRQRDREHDAALAVEQAIDNGEQTDWQEAMREWEEWENSNKE